MEQSETPSPVLEETQEKGPPAKDAEKPSQLRQRHLVEITRRLVTLTAAALVITAAFAYGITQLGGNRTFLVLYVFIAGLIGGFVSIQQRLPNIGLRELRELSGSWLSIVLIPINGGIFAIVLHLIFLAEILKGTLFPVYSHPPIDTNDILGSFAAWLSNAFPEDGVSIAKLFFWSFVAGFSERFVPQIIRKTAQEAQSDD